MNELMITSYFFSIENCRMEQTRQAMTENGDYRLGCIEVDFLIVQMGFSGNKV